MKFVEDDAHLAYNANHLLGAQTYLLETSYDELIAMENLMKSLRDAKVTPDMAGMIRTLGTDLTRIHGRVSELYRQHEWDA